MQTQQFTLTNDIAELPRVVALVDAFCQSMNAGEKDTSSLHLALEEIVTNVITHGYRDGASHQFEVKLEALNTDRIRATVIDDAPAFNPLARADIDTTLALEHRPIGGLGVHLVRKLMDACLYERRDGQNIFAIELVLRRASSQPPTVNIATTKFESSATLALTGRLDGLSSPELEQQVNALLASGIRTLVFDLASLDYVSSAGLRVFIVAAKKLTAAGGTATFQSLTPNVREVFEFTGLLKALVVAPPP